MPHSATDFLAVSLFNNCLSYKLTLFPLPSRPFGKRKRRLPTTSVVQRKLEGTALSARHRFSRSLCTSGEGGPVVRDERRQGKIKCSNYCTELHLCFSTFPCCIHLHGCTRTDPFRQAHIYMFFAHERLPCCPSAGMGSFM